MASSLGKYISKSGATYYYRASDLGKRFEIEFVDRHNVVIQDPALKQQSEQLIEEMERAGTAVPSKV